jgi:hypothetical protein
MKKTTPITLFAVAAALALGMSLNPAAAKIVCWKNKEGIRECGNAVPPEYAQQGIEHKSSSGITIERSARAKTPEELRKEREDAERAAAEKAERDRIAAERAKRDRVLLQTFTTEEDLRLTRDGKIAAIESRIKHSEQLVLSLEDTLTKLQGDAASLERGGRKVPESLQKQISDVRAQMDKTRSEVERREQERVLVQERFEADLARYRELKGG